MMKYLLAISIVLSASLQSGQAKIEVRFEAENNVQKWDDLLLVFQVISTTCQYKDSDGHLNWMTCPLKSGKRQLPNSFRQFKDDLNNDPKDQKFCCGSVEDR